MEVMWSGLLGSISAWACDVHLISGVTGGRSGRPFVSTPRTNGVRIPQFSEHDLPSGHLPLSFSFPILKLKFRIPSCLSNSTFHTLHYGKHSLYESTWGTHARSRLLCKWHGFHHFVGFSQHFGGCGFQSKGTWDAHPDPSNIWNSAGSIFFVCVWTLTEMWPWTFLGLRSVSLVLRCFAQIDNSCWMFWRTDPEKPIK